MNWVDVGEHSFVRIEEIVAVYDDWLWEINTRMVIRPDCEPKAIILLRSGQTLPATVSARTLLRRMRKAAQDG